MYGLAYTGFVKACKEAGANKKIRKTVMVDLDRFEEYLEEQYKEHGKDVYVAYRKAGYSKKFYEAHREELTLHKAAKDAFKAMDGKKIPKVKELNAEYGELLRKKKALYEEYKTAKQEMKDYQTAKYDIDRLLNIDEEQEQKKEEKQRSR